MRLFGGKGLKKSESISKSIRVTLVRSGIGYSKRKKAVLQGLGLRRLNQTVQLKNTAAVRGMINHVIQLVKYEVQA